MPPSIHKTLSPSSSMYWLFQCCAFPNLSKGLESEPNEASLFGEDAHLYSEALIKEALGMIDNNLKVESLKKELKFYSPELVQIAQAYVDKVIEVVSYETNRTGKKPVVLLEQFLELIGFEDIGGSLDFGCLSSDGTTLTIGDLKTGRLAVSKDSSQLKIYALMAYKIYSQVYPIRFIRIFICQPRVSGTVEIVLTPEDLLKFEKEILIPGAKKALTATEEDATPCDYCKWCLAGKNKKCKKFMEENLNA